MGRHDARRTLGQLVVVDPDQPAWIRWVRRAAPYAPSGLWLVLIPWAPIPAILAAGATIAVVRLVRLFSRPGGGRLAVVPTGGPGLRDWQHVEAACRTIANSWPALGDLADPVDIGPTLRRARFQLARLIAAQDELGRSIEDLLAAPRGLPTDDPLRDELSDQRQVLVERHEQMSEQIAARVAALQRLAARSGEFAYQRQVAADARRSLKRAADTAARLPDLPGDDPVQDLTERTEAVLDAYRELIAQTGAAA